MNNKKNPSMNLKLREVADKVLEQQKEEKQKNSEFVMNNTYELTENTTDFGSIGYVDDGFSSASVQSTKRSADFNYNPSNVLNLSKKNLRAHGAYETSLKIKKQYYTLQKIDLSENNLEDEGIMYLSSALKICSFLNSLNLSNNLITEYGLRILLENINYGYLKYLNLSFNFVGSKGAEHLAKFIPTSRIEQLVLNSVGIDEEGGKILGIALSTNNSLKIIELAWNNIKMAGAALLSRGINANYSIEKLSLGYNSFGLEGAIAMADCIKYNKQIKVIELNKNQLNYDSCRHIAQALKTNTTLKYLNLSDNNITSTGIYDLLSSINTEKSGIEFLGLKNIPIAKHLVLIIELIQQRRKFKCEFGPVMLNPDSFNPKIQPEEESMIKLAKFLSDKKFRIIDMFRVLNKQNSLEMDRDEFMRRMKIFEPRLTQKDIINIANSLSKKDTIYYSNLFYQMSKPALENQYEINRKKTQLNEEEEKLKKQGVRQPPSKDTNSTLNSIDLPNKAPKNKQANNKLNKSNDVKDKNAVVDDVNNSQNKLVTTWLEDNDKTSTVEETFHLTPVNDLDSSKLIKEEKATYNNNSFNSNYGSKLVSKKDNQKLPDISKNANNNSFPNRRLVNLENQKREAQGPPVARRSIYGVSDPKKPGTSLNSRLSNKPKPVNANSINIDTKENEITELSNGNEIEIQNDIETIKVIEEEPTTSSNSNEIKAINTTANNAQKLNVTNKHLIVPKNKKYVVNTRKLIRNTNGSSIDTANANAKSLHNSMPIEMVELNKVAI